MAFGAQSYKNNLRKLKEELDSKSTVHNPEYDTALLNEYLFDLSNGDLEPIVATHYYKKSQAKKFMYFFDKPLAVYVPRKYDAFKDLPTFLSPLLEDNPLVNGDFLTGYYIARAFVIPNLVDTLSAGSQKLLKSFHAGITSDGITRGIWYAILDYNESHPKGGISWEFYGCDRNKTKEYSSKYLNGLARKCDVFDPNSIRSIGIQVVEKMTTVDFFIDDVKSTTIGQLLLQLILASDITSDRGFAFVRIPLNWLDNYTQMINVLMYCISSYKVVKIFKTPWGIVPKLYLLVSLPKRKAFTAPMRTGMAKYLEGLSTTPKLNLYNKMIFNVEEKTDTDETDDASTDLDTEIPSKLKPESFMSNLIENLSESYKQIMAFDSGLTTELANALWMDTIRGSVEKNR
jgi:hypothetical protein